MSDAQGQGAAVLRLCLYVAGDSPNSVKAERNLRQLLASYPGRSAELEIRDVLVDPEAGLAAKVLATPTLVKRGPAPELRVVGDLRDVDLLRSILGLGEPEGSEVRARVSMILPRRRLDVRRAHSNAANEADAVNELARSLDVAGASVGSSRRAVLLSLRRLPSCARCGLRCGVTLSIAKSR